METKNEDPILDDILTISLPIIWLAGLYFGMRDAFEKHLNKEEAIIIIWTFVKSFFYYCFMSFSILYFLSLIVVIIVAIVFVIRDWETNLHRLASLVRSINYELFKKVNIKGWFIFLICLFFLFLIAKDSAYSLKYPSVKDDFEEPGFIEPF